MATCIAGALSDPGSLCSSNFLKHMAVLIRSPFRSMQHCYCDQYSVFEFSLKTPLTFLLVLIVKSLLYMKSFNERLFRCDLTLWMWISEPNATPKGKEMKKKKRFQIGSLECRLPCLGMKCFLNKTYIIRYTASLS